MCTISIESRSCRHDIVILVFSNIEYIFFPFYFINSVVKPEWWFMIFTNLYRNIFKSLFRTQINYATILIGRFEKKNRVYRFVTIVFSSMFNRRSRELCGYYFCVFFFYVLYGWNFDSPRLATIRGPGFEARRERRLCESAARRGSRRVGAISRW